MRKKTYPKIIALSEEGIDPFQQLSCLPSGSIFIFRHYAASHRRELAADFLAAARARARQRRQISVLIAGDEALAHLLGADGVHHPEWQISRKRRVARLRPDWHISAAAHSWMALRRAAQAGADFALFSPVFENSGKNPAKNDSKGAAWGLCRTARFAVMAHNIGLPVYALGGITDQQRAKRLSASPCAGWAGVRAFALKTNSD